MYTTSPISFSNVSKRLNELFTDPDHDECEFWTLLKDYIGKLANRLVAQDDIADLEQDCLIQVFNSLPNFKPIKGPSSFTRWVSGIVARRAVNLRRDKLRAMELPISQIGTWIGDEFEATELEDLPNSPVAVQPHDDPDADEERWSRADKITAALDAVRTLLDGDDAVMFDLLRDGRTTYGVGKAFGIEEKAVRRRITVWKGLVKRHGIEVAL